MKGFFIRYLLLFALAFGLTTPGLVLAQPDIGIGPGGYARQIAEQSGYNTAQTATSLSEAVGRVVKIALSMVGTIFLALMIYAGILWMTASGNEEQVEKAVKIIRASAIGLIIVIAGYGLTIFATAAAVGAAAGQVGTQNFWSAFSESFKAGWNSFD